jgi:hypothetical protein
MGLDYFIFQRSTFPETFPPFLFGRYRWDNQLASELIVSGTPVIDGSSSVLCIHQGVPPNVSGHQISRIGSVYNDRLAKSRSGEAYLLGSIDNTPFVIEGQCPSCAIVRRTAVPVENEILALRRAHPTSRLLIILTISAGHIDMAMNWACWSRVVGFENFIFLTNDEGVRKKMGSLGEATLFVESTSGPVAAADYGTLQFQELMTFRTDVLTKFLRLKLVAGTADVDVLWTEYVPHAFDWTCDVIGMPHREIEISGGFVMVQPTVLGLEYWRAVSYCQRMNMEVLYNASRHGQKCCKHTEQECVNKLHNNFNVKFCRLPKETFVDGKAFFVERSPQLDGVVPWAIHNNWLVGVTNKMKRFQEYGLIVWDEPSRQCRFPPALPALPPASRSPWQIKVRVLTSTRPASLARTLASLEAAQFVGLASVKMEVAVDPNPEAVELVEETKRLVNDFRWSHGPYSVHVYPEHVGIVPMWVDATVADNELLFVVEDDIEVSPFVFQYLQAAIERYYVNGSEYDPQMFGLMLQRQHTILGETKLARYGKRKPENLLDENVIFYRYQLMSTWAPVFFPQPWREFVAWTAIKRRDPSYVPCVPGLLSNKWAAEVGKVWSPYFVRFAYERGLYALYYNHPYGAALITNHREPGLHFNGTVKAEEVVPLVATAADAQVLLDALPRLADAPLYDYHMRPVSNTSVLRLRPLFAGIGIDVCHVVGAKRPPPRPSPPSPPPNPPMG